MITLLGTVLAKGRILSFLQDSNVSLARAAHLFPGCIPNIFGLTLYHAVIMALLLNLTLISELLKFSVSA